jgi:hypothetical protein
MFNFEKIVHLVLEQPRPTPTATPPGAPPPPPAFPSWFNNILKKHKDLGLGEVTEADVDKIFFIVTKNYISGQDARSVEKNILILDVLKNLWEGASPKPLKNLQSFLNNPQVEASGIKKSNIIANYTDKEQWVITNGLVANALGKQLGKTRLDYATQALGALADFGGAKLYGG